MKAIFCLSLPLTVWLASFSAIYGWHGLLCSSRWSPLAQGVGSWILPAAVVAAITIQALFVATLLWLKAPVADPLIRRINVVLAVAALASTVWSMVPALLITHCQ